MDPRDEPLTVPDDCVRWCSARDQGLAVLDDMALVDLDWWNTRLDRHRIPVRIAGHDRDGHQIDTGTAYLSRSDLQCESGTFEVDGWRDLSALYLCAAWLYAHPHRGRARRFVDVRTPSTPDQPFRVITEAFAACERSPALTDAGPFRQWSGWPKTPGVGPSLFSLYCWATHPDSIWRPQLLDQQSVSTLLQHGWLENPSVPQFTVARYTRYTDLLHHWARQADTTAELVEMWLTHHWRTQITDADRVRRAHRNNT
ncbi:hypothetical protein RQN9TF_34010 (plasmid) [Rhodococcus qingshengii]|uniref:8-oxoguanine DNA glycosylase OGG fold protein n=4 Tax=Actinomycetes TaxID=1760 RepID=UPI0013DE4485|nr:MULTISPECIES: hypothetical protein [Rhodococcus]BDQ24283.1 hypothetical protein RQN9TF_34010 [Rhodococcus qingshengii]